MSDLTFSSFPSGLIEKEITLFVPRFCETISLFILLHFESNYKVKVKSAPIAIERARRPIRPALIFGFCSMKRLGVFPTPPWMGY